MPARRSGARGEGPGRGWMRTQRTRVALNSAGARCAPSRASPDPGPRTPSPGRLCGPRSPANPQDGGCREKPGFLVTPLSLLALSADDAERMYAREHTSPLRTQTAAPRASAPLRLLPPPTFTFTIPLLFFLILPRMCFVPLFTSWY